MRTWSASDASRILELLVVGEWWCSSKKSIELIAKSLSGGCWNGHGGGQIEIRLARLGVCALSPQCDREALKWV